MKREEGEKIFKKYKERKKKVTRKDKGEESEKKKMKRKIEQESIRWVVRGEVRKGGKGGGGVRSCVRKY